MILTILDPSHGYVGACTFLFSGIIQFYKRVNKVCKYDIIYYLCISPHIFTLNNECVLCVCMQNKLEPITIYNLHRRLFLRHTCRYNSYVIYYSAKFERG